MATKTNKGGTKSRSKTKQVNDSRSKTQAAPDKPTGTKRTKTASTRRAASAAKGSGSKQKTPREPITSPASGIKEGQPNQAQVEEYLRDNPSSGKFPVDRRVPPLEELPADDKRRKAAVEAREKLTKIADDIGKVDNLDPVTAGAAKTARRTLRA